MNADAPADASPKRSTRWSTGVKIVVIGGLVAAGLWYAPWWKEDGARTMSTVSAAMAVAGLFVAWFVLFTATPLAARATVGLLALALVSSVKITGCRGGLVPEFGWRFRSKPDAALLLGGATGGVVEPVDLPPISESDFPQYLGPRRDGTLAGPRLSHNPRDYPPRRLWRQPIGAGFASFAAVGDFAFTQEQRGDDALVVCYEIPTGRIRWTHKMPEERFSSVMGGDGPRITPAVADGRVYVLGAQGTLECLDAATGKPLWSHDIVEENGAALPMWGKSCSPLVVDGLVVVSAGGPNDRSLVAYDAADGELRWHAGTAKSSYASPMLATFDGVAQIVMVNAGDVTGHDPASGRVLWTFDWPGDDPKVPIPLQVDDHRLLISAGYGLGTKLLEVKRDGDDAWSVEPLWESRSLKPKFTNLVFHDGCVYGLDDGRTLTCLDVETGKVRWRGGRYGHGQMLVVGGLLLVQTELDGDVVLIEPNPEKHREVARFATLPDKTWNIPTLSGRRLLVRNHLEAACFELPGAKGP